MTDFMLGGSQITTDDDCSHEIKRRLLLGKKAMTNIQSDGEGEEGLKSSLKVKFETM